MTMIDPDVLKLVESVVRLAAVVWQWLADDEQDQPVSASMTALVVMLDTKPGVRAELVDRCNANSVLRKQLVDLCEAYSEHFPSLVSLKQEISHAAR